MNQQQLREWRREGIGASDAPVIMGASPWRTPFELWEEKALGIDRDFDNPSMRRGRALEPIARDEFNRMMRCRVAPDWVQHPENSWMRASLDGIDKERKIMVEIKCPNKDDHLRAITKKIPDKYVAQCQHQLAVTGLDGMYYFSFDGSKGVIVDVARDQQYIDDMLRQEGDFWGKVISMTAPDLTEKDLKSLKEIIGMEENSHWIKKSAEMIKVKSELKTLEERESELKEELISLSQGRNAQGCGLSLTKSICKGQIDYQQAIDAYLENMRSQYPEINFPDVALEPYRKSSFTKYSFKVK